ncbi:MAG: sodium:calcium antiporter [Actinomycetota bacterium]
MNEQRAFKERTGGLLLIGGTALVCVPSLLLKFNALHLGVELATLLYGVGICAAAFLLSWGAEVAQLDISQALAISFLAFVAVLPEYAVDFTFALRAGHQDASRALGHLCGVEQRCRSLAIANMTGGNRLLIGLGWSAVVLVWWLRTRNRSVEVGPEHRSDIGYLTLATTWAFTIPLRGEVGIIDIVVLGAMFISYILRAARQEAEHPDLIGPPVAIASLGAARRRAITIVLFVFAAGVILLAAQPFSSGLVLTGERLGASPFLMVQWLAPLASEAPEMIIAIMFVMRAKPGTGLGALISSKVNQWTLLIATLPLVYMIARGAAHAMLLDQRQIEEIVLTAAQSAFALAVLADLVITRAEAVGLLVLFLAQFGFTTTASRYGFSIVYGAGFVALLVVRSRARRGLYAALKESLKSPFKA